MSSSNNNTTYKKTSFLAGNNFEFINEFYADYIADPNSLPESWRKFFEGLSDDEKLIYEDLKGPSWSPAKKIKKPKYFSEVKNINDQLELKNFFKRNLFKDEVIICMGAGSISSWIREISKELK